MSQNTNGKVAEEMPETEVEAKAKRRQYTAEYKLCGRDRCAYAGHRNSGMCATRWSRSFNQMYWESMFICRKSEPLRRKGRKEVWR